MNAHDIISTIEAAGFHLAADGEDILVTPPGQLSEEQRQYLRDHKPAILAALKTPGTEIHSGQGGHDIEPANHPEPILATAYTPAGNMMMAEADSAEHAAWIERMNPRMVRCCDCVHANVKAGIARCGAGVDSGLPIAGYWHDDRHLCSAYWGVAL